MREKRKKDALDLIFRFSQRNKAEITAVAVYGIVSAFFYLVTPLAVQELVNFIAFGLYLQPLIILSAFVIFGFFSAGVLRIFELYSVEIIFQRIFVENSFLFLKKIKETTKKNLDLNKINFFMEIPILQKSISKLLLDGLTAILQILIGAIVLVLYHPYFLFFSLGIFGLTVLLFLLGRRGLEAKLEESDSKYSMLAWLQNLNQSKESLAFSKVGKYIDNSVDQLNLSYLDARKKFFGILVRQKIAVLSVQALTNGSLLILGGWLVINDDRFSLGHLVAAELVLAIMLNSLQKVGSQIDAFYSLLVALVKTEKVYQAESNTFFHSLSSLFKLETLNKGLEIESKKLIIDPNKKFGSAVKKLEFKLKPGDWCFIQDKSKVGLSSLDFYQAFTGDRKLKNGLLYLDQTEIRNLSRDSLKEQISLVSPEKHHLLKSFSLESVTIEENEKSGLSLKKIFEILDLEELNYLDQRFENKTFCLDYKDNLTHTESFKLNFARALTKKVRLLIISRFFSALKEEEQEKILFNISENLDFKPTVLFVNTNTSLINQKYVTQELFL